MHYIINLFSLSPKVHPQPFINGRLSQRQTKENIGTNSIAGAFESSHSNSTLFNSYVTNKNTISCMQLLQLLKSNL
jgi:hypothetical protein